MKRLLLCLSCLLPVASIAFADGPGPQRKMTDAEASAYDSVRTVVKGALPKTPEGYSFLFTSLSDGDEGMVPQALQSNEMFRTAYAATYKLNAKVVEDKQTAAFLARAQGTPEQRQRTLELNIKEAELRKARDQAHGSERDKYRAALKAVRAEQSSLMDAIAAGNAEWTRSSGVEASMKEAEQSLPPKELSISVWINAGVSLSDKAAPCSITGAPMALELSDGCQDPSAYCVTIFLGAFDKINKVSGYTLYQPRDADLAVPTMARAMAITVSGPRDRAANVREFAAKIDMAKLQAMLP